MVGSFRMVAIMNIEKVLMGLIGPFTGMLLADSRASVVKIDRHPRLSANLAAHPTPDLLPRQKTSIAVDLKVHCGVIL